MSELAAIDYGQLFSDATSGITSGAVPAATAGVGIMVIGVGILWALGLFHRTRKAN